MTIKLISAVVIILGCGTCGILKAWKYRERTEIIADFMQATERLRIEMNYRREDLPALFLRVSSTEKLSGRFFAKVSELYRQESFLSLPVCWQQAVDEVYRHHNLLAQDYIVIKELGEQLGSCGIEGQEHIMELILQRLKSLYLEAENERKTKGKMYLSLGFTAGITIVILLI